MLGRGTDTQKAMVKEIIKRSGGRTNQVEIVSAAIDLYSWFYARYPIGLDLLPQIPELADPLAERPSLSKKSDIA